MTSKYVMAMIKMPIEILPDGNTITYDQLCQIDFESIDRLPEKSEISSQTTFAGFASLLTHNLAPVPTSIPSELTLTTPKPPIFIPKEQILKQKPKTKHNTTFKNTKNNSHRITVKRYENLDESNSDNEQDVGSVQSLEDPESSQEHGQ